MNQCNFIGNVGQDPEIKYTQNGDPIATLSLATSKKWKSKDGQKQEKTTWVRCTAFGKTAELIGQYVTKGSKLRLTCEYDTGQYTDKNTGETKYTHNFNIREMEFLGGGNQNGQQPQPMQQQAPQQQQGAMYQQPQPMQQASGFEDDDVPF